MLDVIAIWCCLNTTMFTDLFLLTLLNLKSTREIFKLIIMNEILVPEYILKECQDAIRLAANILESRKRETAADRQIEHSERLINWILNGKQGTIPKEIP